MSFRFCNYIFGFCLGFCGLNHLVVQPAPKRVKYARNLGVVRRKARSREVTVPSSAAGGVHVEVGQGLGKLVDSSEARAPSHTDAAEVRPRLPNLGSPLELDERRGTVQFRRSELPAVNQEVVRQLQLLRRC